MYCYKCGKKIENEDVFCAYCGANQNRNFSASDSNVSNNYRESSDDSKIERINKEIDKKQSNVMFIVLPLILAFFVIAIISGFQNNSTSRTQQSSSTSRTTPAASTPLNVTLDELIDAYKTNRIAADQRYKGKTVIITGRITSVFTDPNRIVFEAGLSVNEFLQSGLWGNIYSLIMVLDNRYDVSNANLSIGNTITVEGTFTGLNIFNNLQMNNCRLR